MGAFLSRKIYFHHQKMKWEKLQPFLKKGGLSLWWNEVFVTLNTYVTSVLAIPKSGLNPVFSEPGINVALPARCVIREQECKTDCQHVNAYSL